MVASSRSSHSFTTSRALRVPDGSMRMSSGASTAYEKPRSGRSICMLETPRSRRTASASTPLSASCERTTPKSPRRKRACTPALRSKLSKYGRTLASRSIATKRPLPSRSAASSRACPPDPKVASTTVWPGRTARSSRTSSAKTGTWSVLLRCKALGNKLHAPLDLFQLFAPGGAVPDLDVVPHPGDDDLAAETSVLDEGRRQHDAPLLVQFRLCSAREHEAAHLPCLAAERVEALQAGRHEGVPVLAREHEQAPVHAARDHDAIAQRLAELGRKRESILVIEGVLVLAE